MCVCCVFFFQTEDGIRDLVRSRGLGDVYKRQGFLEDVKWILEQLPGRKQTALFSATMPKTIRDIAQKYLTEPVEITIRTKTVSAPVSYTHLTLPTSDLV